MNIVIITGASSGMGVEYALQLDNIFHNSIDEIWLIARRKKSAAGSSTIYGTYYQSP